MSIVGVKYRITDDWDIFNRRLNSSDSFVYVDHLDESNLSMTVFDISIGVKYFDSNLREKDTPDEGIVLKKNDFIVVVTKEVIATPNNIFGFVSGKCTFIVKGLIVSSGKIEPGFKDNLKIGLVNMSSNSVVLKRGMPFAACMFSETFPGEFENK